jgi:multidrug efflux pump subunit AcrB
VKGARKVKQKITSRWLKTFINGPYDRLLAFCLKWRYATLAFGICTLLLSAGAYQGGWIKFTLFPVVENDLITVQLNMTPGTSVERTTKVVNRLEQTAREAMLNSDAPPQAPAGGGEERRNDSFWADLASLWPWHDESQTSGPEPALKNTISLVGLQINQSGPMREATPSAAIWHPSSPNSAMERKGSSPRAP